LLVGLFTAQQLERQANVNVISGKINYDVNLSKSHWFVDKHQSIKPMKKALSFWEWIALGLEPEHQTRKLFLSAWRSRLAEYRRKTKWSYFFDRRYHELRWQTWLDAFNHIQSPATFTEELARFFSKIRKIELNLISRVITFILQIKSIFQI